MNYIIRWVNHSDASDSILTFQRTIKLMMTHLVNNKITQKYILNKIKNISIICKFLLRLTYILFMIYFTQRARSHYFESIVFKMLPQIFRPFLFLYFGKIFVDGFIIFYEGTLNIFFAINTAWVGNKKMCIFLF